MIVHQLILLFGLIITGYAVNKLHVLDAAANAKISKFLVNVAIPATIIHSAVSQKSGGGSGVVSVFAIAIGFFVLVPILSHFVSRLLRQGAAYELMLTYSNLGFMGIPIISSIYGQEYVFHVTIFMMIFNISIFSQGIYILAKEKGSSGKSFNIRNLMNPGVICALIGLVIFLFRIPVPSEIDDLLASIGSVTTPMAMIVIGSSLAEVPLKQIFADRSMYILAALKLFIYPMIVWLCLRFIVHDPVILGLSVILTSLPTAGNVSMVCSEYGGDLELVSKGTCISTLFSVLSIPFWLAILT